MAEDSIERGKSGAQGYPGATNNNGAQAVPHQAQNPLEQGELDGVVIPFSPNRKRKREAQGAQAELSRQVQAPGGLPPQSLSPQELEPQGPGANQYDFEELLRQVQGKRSRIGKPPREATESLGEWLRWGGSIVGKPFGWLLDLMDDAGSPTSVGGLVGQGNISPRSRR